MPCGLGLSVLVPDVLLYHGQPVLNDVGGFLVKCRPRVSAQPLKQRELNHFVGRVLDWIALRPVCGGVAERRYEFPASAASSEPMTARKSFVTKSDSKSSTSSWVSSVIGLPFSSS